MGGQPAHGARNLPARKRAGTAAAAAAPIRSRRVWGQGCRRRDVCARRASGRAIQAADPGASRMRDVRGWVIVLVLALLIGGAAYFAQPRQDSPQPSPARDAVPGTF